MKKIKNAIMIIVILMCASNVSFAHGGNITGWKDKDSKYITEYNEKYYGYHKENGVVHYHQVKWDEENQKWIIIMPAVYYDENFNKIENDYNEDTNKIEVELVETVDGDTAKFKILNLLYLCPGIFRIHVCMPSALHTFQNFRPQTPVPHPTGPGVPAHHTGSFSSRIPVHILPDLSGYFPRKRSFLLLLKILLINSSYVDSS